METPGFRRAPVREFELGVRRGLTALGIGDPASRMSSENFNKFANKAIMDGLGGSLGSGVSNADRDFIKNTVPNLQNTPDGNRQIIDTMMKLNERKAQSRCLRVVTRLRTVVRIDAGFDDALEKWAEENPLFPKAPEKSDALETIANMPQISCAGRLMARSRDRRQGLRDRNRSPDQNHFGIRCLDSLTIVLGVRRGCAAMASARLARDGGAANAAPRAPKRSPRKMRVITTRR